MSDCLGKTVRDRCHPLFVLRKNRFFARYVLPWLDFQVACRLHRVKWQVHLRLARHLGLILGSRFVDPGLGALFVSVSKLWHPRVFWDVGAGVGYYSWLMASLNADMQVLLFEPDPDNAVLIERTLADAGASFARGKLLQLAASNVSGQAKFAVDRLSGFTGTLLVNQSFNRSYYGVETPFIEVETARLDDVWRLRSESAPDLLKVDVEMAEHLVFEGAGRLLETCRPLVIFECARANQKTLVEWLEHRDYAVLSADAPGRAIVDSVNLAAVPPRYASSIQALLDCWARELTGWPANRISR